MGYEFEGVTVGEVRKFEPENAPEGYVLVNDIRNGRNVPEEEMDEWTIALFNKKGKPAFKGAEDAYRTAVGGLWVVYKYLKTNDPDEDDVVRDETLCYMPMDVFLARSIKST